MSLFSIKFPAIAVLQFDNCEGGALNHSNAISYCASNGMRLPTLAESLAGGGTLVSCPDGYYWTWIDSINNGIYYVWKDLDIGGNTGGSLGLVRCVK